MGGQMKYVQTLILCGGNNDGKSESSNQSSHLLISNEIGHADFQAPIQIMTM
jgi:hypothetical protein